MCTAHLSQSSILRIILQPKVSFMTKSRFRCLSQLVPICSDRGLYFAQSWRSMVYVLLFSIYLSCLITSRFGSGISFISSSLTNNNHWLAWFIYHFNFVLLHAIISYLATAQMVVFNFRDMFLGTPLFEFCLFVLRFRLGNHSVLSVRCAFHLCLWSLMFAHNCPVNLLYCWLNIVLRSLFACFWFGFLFVHRSELKF